MKRLLILAVSAFILSSCVRTPVKPTVYPPIVYPPTQIYPPIPPPPALRQDVFHVVAPGETIWRIGKMYDVEMEDIAQANNLRSPQDLKMGQRLLIPDAAPLRPVVSLYPSKKWRYIIIHHSATDEGNALFFEKSHRYRGWKGLGYHFVIDNGSSGKQDGHIEVSPRWLKQQNGAHCKASGMNSKGIGVCLVGNFSREDVSEKQMDSLVYVVNLLKDYYRIPVKNIIGHGRVKGARTECPGKYFPWDEFYSRIK